MASTTPDLDIWLQYDSESSDASLSSFPKAGVASSPADSKIYTEAGTDLDDVCNQIRDVVSNVQGGGGILGLDITRLYFTNRSASGTTNRLESDVREALGGARARQVLGKYGLKTSDVKMGSHDGASSVIASFRFE